MNNTVVVFGATGLVGRELVSELIENTDCEKVITVTRSRLPFLNPKLEQVQLTDFSALMHVKDKLSATTFYCCIGTTIKAAGSKAAFRQVDLEIPLQIARLANAISVSNLVIISSIGAQASSSNYYLRTKGEMENAVRITYNGNLKIVRPSLLMGNREKFRFGEKFAIAFMKIFGWMLAGPLRKYKGIYARDVAKAMIKVARLPAGKVFFESNELQEMNL
jgi:uncharacterized protein YbjT (DUF2867 family)